MGHPFSQVTDAVFKVSPATGRLEGRWPYGNRPGIFMNAQQGQQGSFSLSAAGAPWQLPIGHWVAAKRPLTQVYPRPDSETNTWARHRLAYYDGANPIQYLIPIGVSFGAFPYHYQVTAGPAGMSIGQNYGDTNYGVLTWTPSGVATNTTVTVQVTDQQLNVVNVTFTISTTSNFLFVDANSGSDSNNGTIAAPFATVAKVMSATYATRCVYFKNGTYNGVCSMGAAVSPMAVMAYPGQSPVWSMTAGAVAGVGSVADAFLQNITFNSGQSSAANYRTIWLGGVYSRQTYHGLKSTNPVNGTASDDNPTFIYVESNPTLRQYMYIVDCTESNRPAGAAHNEASLFITFTTADSLFERNTILNSSAGQGGLYLKSSATRCSVRGNYLVSVVSANGYASGQGDQIDYSQIATQNEWCYNTVDGGIYTALGINRAYTTTAPTNVWMYRNTLIGGITLRNATASNGPYAIENNVLISSAPVYIDGGTAPNLTHTGTECEGSAAAGIVNPSTYLLQGSYLAYLGTRGAQIA